MCASIPSMDAAWDRFFAFDPPIKTIRSTLPLRTAGYIEGFVLLLERFGLGSSPANRLSFRSVSNPSRNLFSSV